MMLWSVVSFAGAIVSFCFRIPSGGESSADNPSRANGSIIPDMSFATTVIMAAIVAVVGAVILITVIFAWVEDRSWAAKSRTGWLQWLEKPWNSLRHGKRRVVRWARNHYLSSLLNPEENQPRGDVEMQSQ